MITLDEIKLYLSTYTITGSVRALNKRQDYVQYLKVLYGEYATVQELVYLVKNDYKEIPKAECNNNKKFINLSSGYGEYCILPKFGKDKCPVCSEKVQNTRKTTNTQIYGVDNPAKAKEVKEKRINTNIERYGTAIPQQLQEIKDKVHNTNLEKYGEHHSRLDSTKEKIKSTVQNKYNIDNAVYLKESVQNRLNEYKSTLQNYVSSYNKELYEFLLSELSEYDVILNDKNIINQEIGIYIPVLKLGIDYIESDKDSNKFQQNKYLLMKESGNRLITIYSTDWELKKELIKERLKNILQKSTKIYARKCTLKELHSKECNKFLDTYHIQGKCSSKIKVGLFYNDKLCAVMTFGKPRFNKKYQYELIRYCSKGTVVGGASKLLKYFESTYHPESLISYADCNWSTGNLYEKIGFCYKGITKPGFFYFDRKHKMYISRFKCQKHRLLDMFKGDVSTLAEISCMSAYKICTEILGYIRIYDSGNLIYVKTY